MGIVRKWLDNEGMLSNYTAFSSNQLNCNAVAVYRCANGIAVCQSSVQLHHSCNSKDLLPRDEADNNFLNLQASLAWAHGANPMPPDHKLGVMHLSII